MRNPSKRNPSKQALALNLALALTLTLAQDDLAASLLDTLVHVVFASAEQTVAASPILAPLRAARHTP